MSWCAAKAMCLRPSSAALSPAKYEKRVAARK